MCMYVINKLYLGYIYVCVPSIFDYSIYKITYFILIRVNNMLPECFVVIIPLLSYQLTLVYAQSILTCSAQCICHSMYIHTYTHTYDHVQYIFICNHLTCLHTN